MSALDENAQFEGEELGDQGWFEDDWSVDIWSEDWWFDDLVFPLYLEMEFGMMIDGGRLGMMVGVMLGLIFLGVLFSLLPLRRLLPLLYQLLLSQKPLQEHQ